MHLGSVCACCGVAPPDFQRFPQFRPPWLPSKWMRFSLSETAYPAHAPRQSLLPRRLEEEHRRRGGRVQALGPAAHGDGDALRARRQLLAHARALASDD